MRNGTSPGKIIAVAAAVLVAVVGIGTCTTYNRLVAREQAVESQWAQVENVYQRRADLVPNLVATVKGAADFERETLTAVTEARSRVGGATTPAPRPPAPRPPTRSTASRATPRRTR